MTSSQGKSYCSFSRTQVIVLIFVYLSDRFFQLSTPASDEILSTHFPNFKELLMSSKVSMEQWPTNKSNSLGTNPLAMPESSLFVGLAQGVLDGEAPAEEGNIIDGSPIVNAVIKALDPAKDSLSLMGRYCNEGNNVGDGVDLAMLVFKTCPIAPGVVIGSADLNFPLSWSTLFGPPLSEGSTLF